MVLVGVVAADLALTRLFLSTGEGLGGLLLVGPAVSLSSLGPALGCGTLRAFSAGVLVTTATSVGGLFAFLIFVPRPANAWSFRHVNGVLHAPPQASQRHLIASGGHDLLLLLVELTMGLPLILVACLGGSVGLVVARRMNPSQAGTTAIDPS